MITERQPKNGVISRASSLESLPNAECRSWLSFGSRKQSNGSDTFTTRFGRELSGTYRYDFDINSCKIAGQEPILGTTGNTRDTPPR